MAGAVERSIAPPTRLSGIQETLTSRELQVALAVAEGRCNREIASGLFISQKTVEYHLGNVFGKLQVRSRTQLALAVIGATSHQLPRSTDRPGLAASGVPDTQARHPES